jgi:subtilisin family serine protease
LDSTTNHEEIAAQIETLGMVKKIWPVRLYKKPRVETEELLNVADVHNLQKRQSLLVDTYEVHKMGGVDLLRAEGYTGKGLFVAIVDTGVDYNHPALGGGFGPGFKIAHGYDLVGDAYDGTNTPVPDPDPFASCEGHGTHVGK